MCAYVPSYTPTMPIYQPAVRVISSITNALQATVATTVPHQYRIGTIVRFDIPLLLGMQQINQQVGTILTIPTTTTFTTDINTTNYDLFVVPSSFPPPYQDGQVTPIGTKNDMVNAVDIASALQNVLPYSAT